MLASPLTPSTSGSPFPPEGSHASGGGNSYKGHLMTGLFAENFWGDTDQYYQGFETLAKHMRQGGVVFFFFYAWRSKRQTAQAARRPLKSSPSSKSALPSRRSTPSA